MSTLATWDKISGALGSTTTTFGGEWANLISDYFNGVNIAISDPTKVPRINTITRFKQEKLGLFDGDESHDVLFSVDDIDTGPTRKIRIRRMNAPFETDYMLFEGLPATILNKNISGSNNTFTNIPDTALSSNVALENTTNIFTTFQKIQYGSTAALTLYRPDNTPGNGTGMVFNLQNSTPTEITYAQILAINNDNAVSLEDSSLAFYTRSAGALADRLLIDNLNRIRVGISGSGIYIDPTGISGGSKVVTFPNTNIKALGESNTAIITNKEIDVRNNTILRMARVGAYSPSSPTGQFTNDAWGALQGMVGVGLENSITINTGGKIHVWQTAGNTTNDCAGVIKIDAPVAYRLMEPLIRFAFRLDADGATTRMFKGWTSQRLLTLTSNTEPLISGETGFLFGYGAGDTNFQIFHNDSTGTCQKTPTSVPLPGVNTNYILEIKNDGASFTWTLYNVDGNNQERSTMVTNGTGTISTETPPTGTTPLYMQDLMIKTTAVAQQNYIHYVEVY